jgi:nitrate reductase molybdenum cofactor assembly chaperone NarJ/NarW
MSFARRSPRTWSDEQLLIAWQSASLLLGYPDESLVGQLDLIRTASRPLPDTAARPICEFVDHAQSMPLARQQVDYVETFDTKRRCNLFLTYFTHGDTRNRGMALLRFKQTYLRSGWLLDDCELPDHLCVVLEYAATVNQKVGRELLLEYRAGLELLRLSLREIDSPWSLVLDAVSATLPPLHGNERDAVRRLAAEGPPDEEVGLAPFAAAQFSPSAATERPSPDGSGPVLLPMPTFPGVRT